MTVIHLGQQSPLAQAAYPGSVRAVPYEPYLACSGWSFTVPRTGYQPRGALLPHPFHLSPLYVGHRRFAPSLHWSGFPVRYRTRPAKPGSPARLPPKGRRRGGRPVSFGAQYRGSSRDFAHPCAAHSYRQSGSNISGCPINIVVKAPRKASSSVSMRSTLACASMPYAMHYPTSCVRLPARQSLAYDIFSPIFATPMALYREYFGYQSASFPSPPAYSRGYAPCSVPL